MAAALIGGLIARGSAASDIAVVDPSDSQRASLGTRFGVACLPVAEPSLVGDAGVIVLAVKPQQMRLAVASLAPAIADQLVVSVAAGIRIADLSRWLGGHRRLVRAMPNTPALIGLGTTGLAAPDDLASGDRSLAWAASCAAPATVPWASSRACAGLRPTWTAAASSASMNRNT